MGKANAERRKIEVKEQGGLAKEIMGVILIVVGILFGICVFSDSQTVLLKALRSFAFGVNGVLGYALPFIFAAAGLLSIFSQKLKIKAGTVVLGILGLVSLFSLVHLLGPYGQEVENGFGAYIEKAYVKGSENISGGGVLGSLLAYPLSAFIGVTGGAVILIAIMLICVMAIGHISLNRMGRKLGGKVKEGAHKAAEKIKEENEKRELRIRQKVEQEAFNYDTEENYPKGTAYNEVLGDEEYSYDDRYDDYYRDEPEEPEEVYEFDTQASYELQEQPETAELDLSGLRIVDKMHGRAEKTQPKAKKKKKSFDFEVEADDQTYYDEPEAESYEPHNEQEYEYEPAYVYEEQPAVIDDITEEPIEEETQIIEPEVIVPQPKAEVKPEKKEKKFVPPSVQLLNKPNADASDQRQQRGEMDECARKLEDTFESFGVSIHVVNATRGPKVTRYELQPAAGVKISKIKGLSDDIALAMAAESVRIEAPIPGKSYIGIELPNKTSASVCIRELIDSTEFRNSTAELPFALGKDIAGKNIFDDLARMPHLLVAGTTGSGKSVYLNTVIMSLIYKLPPTELQLIMIDPKMVEMGVYNDIPYLKVPVVTDKAKAAGALVWAVQEMERRYKLFHDVGVRNIKTYNQKRAEYGEAVMPKLVIIIDEFADLMMVSAKDVEDAVCRIAQLGRASGIHLIIATQSPRADIFTGLIKANVPSRIALTVGNPLESRIVMDEMGAEKLLGNGDLLYRPVGKNKSTRIQGAWISDEEIARVTDYLKSVSDAKYDDDVENEMKKLGQETGSKKNEQPQQAVDAGDGDELLPQAVHTVLEFEQASASMLQRKMRVGYSRAARLMDQLEDIGCVGPQEGSKGRQILWTWADYNEHFGGDEAGDEEYYYED